MARYEHLPIYKAALDLAVHFEKLVAGFSRYHKYTLGTELREASRAVLIRTRKSSLAVQPSYVELQVDAPLAARQVAGLPRALVVPARSHSPSRPANCFFGRRTRSIRHALGSPKIPRASACARNPGNVYASVSRRFRLEEVAIQT